MKYDFKVLCAFVMLSSIFASASSQPACAADNGVPENLFKSELLSYPGAYSFELPRFGIVLVSDTDLDDLQDPDKVVNLSCTFEKYERTLRQVCEEAKATGSRTLIVAYDQFFVQYRPGQHAPRK